MRQLKQIYLYKVVVILFFITIRSKSFDSHDGQLPLTFATLVSTHTSNGLDSKQRAKITYVKFEFIRLNIKIVLCIYYATFLLVLKYVGKLYYGYFSTTYFVLSSISFIYIQSHSLCGLPRSLPGLRLEEQEQEHTPSCVI